MMFRLLAVVFLMLLAPGAAYPSESLVAKLQRLAAQAAVSNPYDAPVATGVSMTTSTTLDGGLTKAFTPSTAPNAFATHGGTATLVGDFWAFPVSSIAPDQRGNLAGYFPSNKDWNAVGWEVEFTTPAPVVMIKVSGFSAPNSNFRIIVDGHYVTKTPMTYATTGVSYVRLDFGGVRAPRHIQFRGMTGNIFGGVYVDPASTVSAPDQSDVVKVAITGDSYTDRIGVVGSTEAPDDMWVHVLGHLMGWRDIRQVAVGSTGYVNDGVTRSNIAAQIPRWIGIKPDVIVFAGGYNDPVDGLTTNALADFRAARAGAPSAPIFVLGPWAGAGGQTQGLWDKENAIKAAFDAWSDPNSYWIPQDQIAQPWLFGTGYVGHENGTGNTDAYISDDAVHPSIAGHEYLGHRAFAAILPIVAALKPSTVGAYVWGGVLTRSAGVQRFYDTVDLVLKRGFETVRVAPGPSAIYGVTIPDCTGANDTLTCYAKVMFASSAWDNPGLKHVMLTAIDRTCTNAAPANNGCLTASTLTANKAAIEKEYTDLLNYMAQRFAGRNVDFWLSNWEGDNFVYCGNAVGYGMGGAVTTSCNAAITANGQTKEQRLQAFSQWLSYRDEAVANFKAANPGVNVIHAPEFNNYKLFSGGCGGSCVAGTPSPDSVLGQIQAAGGREYCSYSSYDTQGPAGGSYLAAVDTILGICKNLIIGEAGYDLLNSGAAGVANNVALYGALDQIRNLYGVLAVIPWNAVNPSDGYQQLGMFDSAGRDQLLHDFGPLRPTPQPPTFQR
jgi:lysophospholipase L1-like esterase